MTNRTLANGDLAVRRANVFLLAAIVLLLSTAWWFGLREPVAPTLDQDGSGTAAWRRRQVEEASHYDSPMRSRGALEQPIDANTVLPPLEPKGWVNGRPDSTQFLGNVLVIDVWDDDCPYCAQAAPDLVEAYQFYHPRGVEFLGFTWADEATARRFVERHGIAWPNGFEATPVIDVLQAAAPTIFVVARRSGIMERRARAIPPRRRAIDQEIAGRH